MITKIRKILRIEEFYCFCLEKSGKKLNSRSDLINMVKQIDSLEDNDNHKEEIVGSCHVMSTSMLEGLMTYFKKQLNKHIPFRGAEFEALTRVHGKTMKILTEFKTFLFLISSRKFFYFIQK